jgi:SHS2 domain-containing protein
MRQYEFLDISGDAGIRAFGNTAEELFLNAAIGMYSLIADLEAVGRNNTIEVSIRHDSAEGLLVAWLNELIFHFDAHGFIGKEIVITEPPCGKDISEGVREYAMTASVSGEHFDPKRHKGKLLLKAATYHKLKIEHRGGCWTAEVVFDI